MKRSSQDSQDGREDADIYISAGDRGRCLGPGKYAAAEEQARDSKLARRRRRQTVDEPGWQLVSTPLWLIISPTVVSTLCWVCAGLVCLSVGTWQPRSQPDLVIIPPFEHSMAPRSWFFPRIFLGLWIQCCQHDLSKTRGTGNTSLTVYCGGGLSCVKLFWPIKASDQLADCQTA